MNFIRSGLVVAVLFQACGVQEREGLGTSREALRIIGDPGGGGEGTGGGASGGLSVPANVELGVVEYDDVAFGFECGFNADEHVLLATEAGGVAKVVASTTCSGGDWVLMHDQLVEPGKQYCWAVEARTAYQSARSAARCATAPLDPRPVAAPGLRVELVDSQTANFDIQDLSNNEGGFRYEARRVGAPSWNLMGEVPRTTRRHGPVGELLPRISDHRFAFTPGDHWEFRALAYKDYSPAFAYGATVEACTLSLCPTDARTEDVTTSSMVLRWGPAAGAQRYDIIRSDGNTFSVGAPTTALSVSGLPPNTNFCFDVFAVNACGVRNPAPSHACGRTQAVDTLHADSVLLTIDPPYEGTIAWNGVFPPLGVLHGELRAIGFAKANDLRIGQMIFISPGAPNTNCDDPSTAVVLNRGEKMSAADIAKLYGTSTPALPIAVRACYSTTEYIPGMLPPPRVSIDWFGH